MEAGSRRLRREISIGGVQHPPGVEGPDWTNRLGDRIDDRYELLSVIDGGGQGVVYRAKDLRDGDEVAIKVLKDGVARNSEWRERMFREALALTSLSGTAAVRVLDQRWTSDGALCLVMELLRGADLETVLERLAGRGHSFPLDALDLVFEPLINTIERAHEQGIFHRDLKPANIFVVDSAGGPTVKLLDFGFAKFVRMRSFTLEGTIAGSPSYIAPELWLGGGAQCDHRIDVYSLGAVLFRTLGGVPPFVGINAVQIYEQATGAPRPSLKQLRPELPDVIDDWVQLALAVLPEARFSSVRALYTALRHALST